MSQSHILQSYVPLNQSLRFRLSQSAYHHYGLSLFPLARLPFADYSSLLFARKLAALFNAQLKSRHFASTAPLHLYELGCGQGLLGYNLLQTFYARYPHLYHRLHLHLSDAADSTITALQKLPLWHLHRRHISFQVIDAIHPHFDSKPDIIYHVNLFDSLPYQVLQPENHALTQIQVSVSLALKAYLIDAAAWPPQTYQNSRLVKLATHPDFPHQYPHLVQPLLRQLEFTPQTAPTDPLDLPPLTQGIPLNYSHEAYLSLTACLSALNPQGLLFISDFGTSSLAQASFSLNFNQIAPASVSFPLLAFQAQALGFQTRHTSFPQDNSCFWPVPSLLPNYAQPLPIYFPLPS